MVPLAQAASQRKRPWRARLTTKNKYSGQAGNHRRRAFSATRDSPGEGRLAVVRGAPARRENRDRHTVETLSRARLRSHHRSPFLVATHRVKKTARTQLQAAERPEFFSVAGARGSKHRGQSPLLRGVEPWVGADSVRDRHERHKLNTKAETKTARVLHALAPLSDFPSLRP